MNTAITTKSRGTVLKIPDSTPGILFGNGAQQSFTLERVWKSPVAPAADHVVDVEFDGVGAVTGIIVVDQQQIAKERRTELSGVAQERGKEAALLAQQVLLALGSVRSGACRRSPGRAGAEARGQIVRPSEQTKREFSRTGVT